MPSHPASLRLGVLRFRLSGIPEHERDTVSFLQWLIGSLEGYIRRFDAALQLINHETERIEIGTRALLDETGQINDEPSSVAAWMRAEQAVQWSHIAARDAAISVYHIHHVLEALKIHVGQIGPTLRDEVDVDPIRKARALFKNRFPSAEMLRHGVAHSAENAKSISKAEFNAIKLVDGEQIESFEGVLAGDFFGLTVGGKLEGMRLNTASLDQLRQVQALVHSGFERAAARSHDLMVTAENSKRLED